MLEWDKGVWKEGRVVCCVDTNVHIKESQGRPIHQVETTTNHSPNRTKTHDRP